MDCGSGFTQIGETEFSIRFDGRVLTSGKSTWNYTLCWTGHGDGFSHVVLELCPRIGESNIVAASPAGWSWGDPLRHDDPDASRSAKINGIKWGDGDPFGGSAGTVALSFKLDSVFPVGAGAVRTHISAGGGSLHDGHANVDGPQCTATPTPTPCRTSDSSHSSSISGGSGGCPTPTPCSTGDSSSSSSSSTSSGGGSGGCSTPTPTATPKRH